MSGETVNLNVVRHVTSRLDAVKSSLSSRRVITAVHTTTTIAPVPVAATRSVRRAAVNRR